MARRGRTGVELPGQAGLSRFLSNDRILPCGNREFLWVIRDWATWGLTPERAQVLLVITCGHRRRCPAPLKEPGLCALYRSDPGRANSLEALREGWGR